MNKDLKQKGLLSVLLVIGLGVGFLANSSNFLESSGPGGLADNSSWTEKELQAVESGESFTISELERPVLIETFAVWCTTCSRQQQEIKKLHESRNITSVSLNVDQNENEEKVLNHKKQNGFDWIYAISPIELTNVLRQRFGNSIANPPSAPVILICDGEANRLEKEDFGSPVKSADFLEEKIKSQCQTENSSSPGGAS